MQPENDPLWAIAFVMNRQVRFYVGRLSAEKAADLLARACGHWVSGAEYLYKTASHLEEHGIHDRVLWKLQELGAGQIEGCATADIGSHSLL